MRVTRFGDVSLAHIYLHGKSLNIFGTLLTRFAGVFPLIRPLKKKKREEHSFYMLYRAYYEMHVM